jgi:predicted ATPase/DNA-binding CsgD family transcriptional regulator
MMRRHNLPAPRTSLIGREDEVAAVRRLLLDAEGRLVTLTGTGGCGKTRLALRLAGDLLDVFPDGVWLVELAPLSDPALVPDALAVAAGVRERSGRTIEDVLVEALAGRDLLLVLDNCEHLVDACARLVETLLHGCPALRLLATSREPLRIAGEVAWRVPSLRLPDPEATLTPEALLAYPATRLFVERATAVEPGFAVSAQNARAVAEICARLDGIALAIELAAARTRLLSPEQIVGRLGDRFRLLSQGSRTAPERHQTLSATLDWSHELLAAEERVLFRRLAVFAGGWDLEAAEAVCAGDGLPAAGVMDALGALVAKSLVQVEAGGEATRYRLLETLRQYGGQRLDAAGEAEGVRRRHAAHFLALAERSEPHLRRAEAGAWLDRLHADHDNLRAALAWGEQASGAADLLPRLAGALWMFWWQRGHFAEGRRWLEAGLGRPAAPAARVKALFGAASLAGYQDDYARARALWQDLLALGRESGDEATVAWALGRLGYVAMLVGEYDRAARLCAESVAISRRLGDDEALALALMSTGHLASARGDLERAAAAYEEGAALDRVSGTAYRSQYWLASLGAVAAGRGELDRAAALCAEALALARQRGDLWASDQALRILTRVARRRSDHEQGAALAAAHLALLRELGSRGRIAECFENLAWVARVRGQAARAARLLGAAHSLRQALGRPVPESHRGELEADLADARAALGERAFAAAWTEGQALDPQGEIAAILGDAPPAAAGAPGRGRRAEPAPEPAPDPLTRRERQVAALVARGLTNREIARELVITEGTVGVHVEHILAKLELRSRTQVAAWVIQRGLLAES